MKFEIEFLPVGEASKGGDAIVIKYEGTNDGFYLMVIDGGTVDSGQELINHIKRSYGPNAIIAHAILTHSDTDHAAGFREIVQELDVRNVWMHLPWVAAQEGLAYFADKRWTAEGIARMVRAEYDLIVDIHDIASKRGMNVYQPFAGQKIGPFTVLSPYKDIYRSLVPQFDRTPDPDQTAIEASGLWIEKSPGIFARLLDTALAKSERWIEESWEKERLKDGGKTSACNESSVVLYGDLGMSEKVLLTGDAGYWGLSMALYCAGQSGLPMQNFSFVQIPHHGSRSNVGPSILNQVIGPILPKGSQSKFFAYVSAPKDDEKHPRKMVVNAFIRRGGSVIGTQGITKCYTVGYKMKQGYEPTGTMQFAYHVEDYD